MLHYYDRTRRETLVQSSGVRIIFSHFSQSPQKRNNNLILTLLLIFRVVIDVLGRSVFFYRPDHNPFLFGELVVVRENLFCSRFAQ